jgi:hypothetical protein
MNSIEQIRQVIDQEIFDYTQLMMALKEYRKPRDVVSSLLRKNQIIRIRKGLYIFGPLWCRNKVSVETLANLVYGPSVISLEYALSWYGLIPEHVETITSITTGRSRVFHTPAGRFSYLHLSAGQYATGITIQGSTPMNWLMAEPLKALADKVWSDKRFQPVSATVFTDYLFSDLRIDELALENFYRQSSWKVIEQKYTSRKISFLGKYLLKRFGD